MKFSYDLKDCSICDLPLSKEYRRFKCGTCEYYISEVGIQVYSKDGIIRFPINYA